LLSNDSVIFLIGIVQLGPLGTAATNRPVVLAPGNYDDEEIGEMMTGRGTEVLGQNLLQCCFVHNKPQCSAMTRTRAAVVGSQRLTA
jgi:hypothetical protein